MMSEDKQEEEKPQSKKEERALSVLEQVKAEREATEKMLIEAREEREKLENLKANEMMSGKTDSGSKPEKPKEETPAEYKARIEREISEGKFKDR